MKRIEPWFVPDWMTGPGKYRTWFEEITPFIEEALGDRPRRTAIQAGGHLGIWPLGIAKDLKFEQVFTFEPDAENFECLRANISGVENIWPMRAFVGAELTNYSIKRSSRNTGQHTVGTRGGNIQMITIDSLKIKNVNLICFDLEGFEMLALRGAQETVMTNRPVIVAEENKRCLQHGFQIGDLEKLMWKWGYRVHARVREDIVFV